MKQNAAMTGMRARFGEILDAFDDYAELEELNAEFEDALFFMENIDTEAEDADEEIADAVDELDALCGEYEDACKDSDAKEIAERMRMAVGMARRNLCA